MPKVSPNAQRAMRDGQKLFRERLIAQDRLAAQRLAKAYQSVIKKLGKDLSDLRSLAAQDLTPRDFAREAAALRLRDDLIAELRPFANQISSEAARGEESGLLASRGLARIGMNAAGIESFNQPTVGMMRALVNYTDSDAFKQAVERFAGFHANNVSDLILVGAAKGQNPNTIARNVVNYIDTFPRADANRMVRTVTIWSARSGVQNIYRQNADVVGSWIWSASIGDPRTCESCVMMHGTVHKLEETLDDHHSGRCAPLPITESWKDLGFEGGKEVGIETGIDWFQRQPDSVQQGVLGMASWKAWKDGAYKLEQIPTQYQDSIYGPMRRASSLKELVGAETARQYMTGRAA